MILKQYYLGCLSQASYLIGDEEEGVAAVVDPRRDVDVYLEAAEKCGVAIRHVILTHFHADFVAGHVELQRRLGAKIYLGKGAQADYPFEELSDGDELRLGAVRLRILHTPGHTPEGISILIYDPEVQEAPHAVLTGDTLFIGDVGRPDLMASVGVSAEELAGMLYDSLHEKLLKLPDETLVYPGHGAGSMCGKNLSSDTVSTIGDQKRFNHALQPMAKEEFVRLLTTSQLPAPGYFSYDADLNRRERRTLEESLEACAQGLSLAEVVRAGREGAQLLDVRDPGDFARGHLPGSVNIGLGGRYATWAGTVLDREKPIVLIAPAGKQEEAALRLGRIGFDHVLGHLQGGTERMLAEAKDLVRIERVGPAELARELDGADPPVVLDIRGPGEREASSIEGSLSVPLDGLTNRLAELPTDRPIVIHCATGYRSMIAASLLEQHGFRNACDLEGGIEAWAAEGRPTLSAAKTCG